MGVASFLRLGILAAIWGGSFLFMRIAAPVLGPGALVFLRVGFAAVFLLVVARLLGKSLKAREHWRHYLMLGLFNSALPFFLFAFAARTLSASMLSILNATAPIWGALIGALWSRQALPAKTWLGLGLGVLGVSLLVGFDRITFLPGAGVAILAAVLAAGCYGIATTYAKTARALDAFANAHGSMWAATLLIAPVAWLSPASAMPGPGIWLSVLALGVLCSGVAYLLYFRLVADVGATSTLTVTFLIPLFGILWGWLFLGETVGWNTVLGSSTIIAGTVLVTGFNPRALLRRVDRSV